MEGISCYEIMLLLQGRYRPNKKPFNSSLALCTATPAAPGPRPEGWGCPWGKLHAPAASEPAVGRHELSSRQTFAAASRVQVSVRERIIV